MSGFPKWTGHREAISLSDSDSPEIFVQPPPSNDSSGNALTHPGPSLGPMDALKFPILSQFNLFLRVFCWRITKLDEIPFGSLVSAGCFFRFCLG